MKTKSSPTAIKRDDVEASIANIEKDDQNNLTMNEFMTVTSAASVSKNDIELLENKISVLEK